MIKSFKLDSLIVILFLKFVNFFYELFSTVVRPRNIFNLCLISSSFIFFLTIIGLSKTCLTKFNSGKEAGLKEIILCHVISREDVGFVPFGGYLKEEEEKIREEVRIRFEDWQKTISENGVDSKIVITVGDPIPRILHTAEDEKADMIVVGQKKREAMEILTGTSAIKIISRSKIPTLISKYRVHYKINDEEYEKVNDRIFEAPMLVTNWTEQCEHALNTLISLKGSIGKAIVFHNIDVHISSGFKKGILL